VPSIDVPIGTTFVEELLIRGRMSETGKVTYDHHVILAVYTKPAILSSTQPTFTPILQRTDALTAETASAMGYPLSDILNAATVAALAERDAALAAQTSAQAAKTASENAAAKAQARIVELEAQVATLQGQFLTPEEKK